MAYSMLKNKKSGGLNYVEKEDLIAEYLLLMLKR